MQITGKLINAEYFDTSRSGNPRYICVIQNDYDSVMFYTGVDSMHAYEIRNYLNNEIVVNLQYKRGKLTLELLEKV